MKSTEERQISTARFAELGLSETLIEYAARQRYPARYGRSYWTLYLGFFVVMCAVWAGAYVGAGKMARRLEERRLAEASGAWYYEQFVGPSAVLTVFVAILLVAYLATLALRKVQGPAREYMNLKSLESAANAPGLSGKITRAVYRWLLRDIGSLSPELQLKVFERRMLRSFAWPLAVLAVVMAGFAYLDLSHYYLVGPRGLRTTTYWTARTQELGWNDLIRVETGCWIYDQDGLKLHYEPVFKGDARVNLMRASERRDLEAAMKVEATVKRLAVKKQLAVFDGGVNRGLVMFHDGCVAAIQERYKPEERRIIFRLLQTKP